MDIAIERIAEKLQNVSILVAEDDRNTCTLLTDIFHAVGFHDIRIAHDGQTAIDMLRERHSDLLISDWRMQPMDGLTLTRYLRNSPDSPNRFIPVVMLTGNSELKHVEKARDAGVSEFVVKPFTVLSLLEHLKAVVERPRSFVLSQHYKGPDRRRKPGDPPSGSDKRSRPHRYE